MSSVGESPAAKDGVKVSASLNKAQKKRLREKKNKLMTTLKDLLG